MHNILLSVSYKSLGKILEDIHNYPAVVASPELVQLVRNAISFHQQLQKDFSGLLEENQELKEDLSRLTREPGEIVDSKKMFDQFEKYERMRDAGKSPQDIYEAAKSEGLDSISLIKALRAVFNLSMNEATEIIDRVEKE